MINSIKGYGFIISEDDDEIYFHLKDLYPKFRNQLVKEGDKVGFDVKKEMKGDRAVNIRLL